MLRRELLKSLVGLAGLAILPLAVLAPKYATGGVVRDGMAIDMGMGCLYSFPPGDYVIQTKRAESEVIVTTELRGGELRIVNVRQM